MSTEEDWPERRRQVLLNHPELFRTPLKIERQPPTLERTESSP